ncbi:MAG TPA: sensor histidine kinase, partial [Spirochaetota bacterium]
ENKYTWVETYGKNELSNPTIRGILVISREISKRKEIEARLIISLEEKDILMQELHHRVKNNMMTIISLLQLQSADLSDEKALTTFQDAQNRIRSMMLIYEKLYQTGNVREVNLAEYLRDLIDALRKNYVMKGHDIVIKTDLSALTLDMKRCTSIGLMTNEIITNSIKHAFPHSRKGEIRVTLFQNGDSVYLTFSDNGIGFPEDFDPDKTKTFGMKLIHYEMSKLGGSVTTNKDGHPEICIRFPLISQP